MKIFEESESNVRAYIRDFPTVFATAKGYRITAEDGAEFIDFFAGAGALNYGHNPEPIKKAVLAYMEADGITHALDMATTAKAGFIERFRDVILKRRGMRHKLLFPGPTGTNAVEAALKLARKVTGRHTVVSFTNGFHGMTLGALATTGNAGKRGGAGVPLGNTVAMPYDGFLGDGIDTTDVLARMLDGGGSGLDDPACVIVETVQGEGGLNAAGNDWLKRLERLCRRHGMLLVVDDIQAGCGRTGSFFSFETAGIDPDIVCLSKSIGGYGLPMSLLLVKPEYDVFRPGEHNGTFRGNNPAFVAATAALDFWEDESFERAVAARARELRRGLTAIVEASPGLRGKVRGRGLLQGIAVGVKDLAGEICAAAFARGLLVETSGPDGEVVKAMPPLVIDEAGLTEGLAILERAVEDALKARRATAANVA